MSRYGSTLKTWRSARRLSQLELATVADVSQRHVSFLETGRARPSREMVIHLAIALDVPLRDRNAMLAAAGYSPEYNETALTEPAFAQVRGVLETILDSHEPFPAIVVDRGWNVVIANSAAMRFTATMIDPGAPLVTDVVNAFKIILHPEGVRPFIVNWEQVAATALRRLSREVAARPADTMLSALWDEVLTYRGVAEVQSSPSLPSADDLLIPIQYRIGNHELSLFSTIATIGEAHDITLEELRLESFFAADRETEQLFRSGVL
jgi:transcriptional regulator with XRE-family HTH domain